jgi:hypothetical protein
MGDMADLAVHRDGSTDNFAAEGLPDRLLTKADAQHRDPSGRGDLHEVEANPGAVGVAGARGDYDPLRSQRDCLVNHDLVVATHNDLGPQFAEKVEKIIGEAVVIIDQQEHRSLTP